MPTIAPRPITGTGVLTPKINPKKRNTPEAFKPFYDNPLALAESRARMLAAKQSPDYPLRKKLTLKQQRFVAEYLADPKRNVRKAYIKAGYQYTEQMLQQEPYKLLDNPVIAGMIVEEDRRIFQKLEITREKILHHVAACAFVNPLEYFTTDDDGNLSVDISRLADYQGLPIQDIKVEIDAVTGKQIVSLKLADKLTALALLGKRLKVFGEEPATNNFYSVSFIDKLMAGQASMAEVDPTQLPKIFEGSLAEETT